MPPWKIDDAYGRYKSWAGNIGAHQIGRKSLDYRLKEDNTSTKELVIELLSGLCKILDDSTSILHGVRDPFEELSLDSDSSDSDFSEDEDLEASPHVGSPIPSETELQKLLYSLESVLDNLYALSVIIRQKPLSYDRYLKSSRISLAEGEKTDVQHVIDKFPQAEQWLAVRVGNASLKRRQYLKYRSLHAAKMLHVVGDVAMIDYGTMDYISRDTHSDAISNAPLSQIEQSQILRTRHSHSVDLSTAASTYYPGEVATKIAQFSTTNDDIDTDSKSCSSSVAGSERVNIPRPPRVPEGGGYFVCPYCHEPCKLDGKSDIQRRRQWKVHVFEDLQPYVCTFQGCEQAEVTMYDNRSDWWAHERQVHRKEWCCNAVGHDVFTKKTEFFKHMQEQHSETTDSLKNSELSTLFERPLERATTSCQFCASDDTSALSATQLQRHLAGHLEVFAARVLPKSSDEIPEDSASDIDTDAEMEVSNERACRTCTNTNEKHSAAEFVDDPCDHRNDKGDLFFSDVRQDSIIDALVKDFCLIEDNDSTMITRTTLEEFVARIEESRLNWDDIQAFQSPSKKLHAMVRLSIRLQLATNIADCNVADFMTQLHSTLNAELETILERPDQEYKNLKLALEAEFSQIIRLMISTIGNFEDGEKVYYLQARLTTLLEGLVQAIQDTREDNVQLNAMEIGSLPNPASTRHCYGPVPHFARARSGSTFNIFQSLNPVLGFSPGGTFSYLSTELAEILQYGPVFRHFIRKVLRLMSVSLRPLSAKDLKIFDITTPMLDDKPFSEYSTVREACSKLIAVIPPSPPRGPPDNTGASEETIRLTHPSLRYYLFSYQIRDTLGPWSVFSSDEGENNSSMADACLENLLKYADHPSPDRPLRETYTLLSYAAEFWFVHARDLVDPTYPKEKASQSTLTKLFVGIWYF